MRMCITLKGESTADVIIGSSNKGRPVSSHREGPVEAQGNLGVQVSVIYLSLHTSPHYNSQGPISLPSISQFSIRAISSWINLHFNFPSCKVKFGVWILGATFL